MRSLSKSVITAAMLLTGVVASEAQQNGMLPVVAGPAVSGVVLKSTPGNLYSISAYSSAAGFLMVFNSSTAPANGATTPGTATGGLVQCIPVAAGGMGYVDFAGGPTEVYTSGIYAAFSSTGCGTLTLSATAFFRGRAL